MSRVRDNSPSVASIASKTNVATSGEILIQALGMFRSLPHCTSKSLNVFFGVSEVRLVGPVVVLHRQLVGTLDRGAQLLACSARRNAGLAGIKLASYAV